MSERTDWAWRDAAHDAHQDRLLAEARGQRIANPAAWESKAALRFRMAMRRQARREGNALALYLKGMEFGDPDIYGRREVLRGEEYREHVRKLARANAARKRAKGIKRSGRDG